jgi:ferredoxin--NADP+ reductase
MSDLVTADLRGAGSPATDPYAPDVLPKHVTAETVLTVGHWTDRLFSFTCTRAPTLRFESGQFVMIGLMVEGKPLLRAYSMASAHYEDHLEFLSIKVSDGPLTSRLQHLRPGDKVLIGRKPTGTLLLGNLRPARNLYFLSTGTGLAPFMSLVRDPEVYDHCEKLVLVHGCRRVAELAYSEYITEHLPAHELLGEMVRDKLLYYPTVTRESFHTEGRVTELLRSGRLHRDLDLEPLDPGRDRVMICGSQEMLDDLKTLLVERGFNEGHNGVAGDFVYEKAFADK